MALSKGRYPAASKAIGTVVKAWRLERGMTMRDVTEASHAHHEPINFDYLSRLEAGQLMPSIPKLAGLASVFGRSLTQLTDIYELETLRRAVPKGKTYQMLRGLGLKALGEGDLPKALALFLGALDAAGREKDLENLARAHNNVGGVLIRVGRYLES